MVPKENTEFQKRFNCDDVGEVKEYVGCKLNWDEQSIKFTQPVLLQSFSDEFEISDKQPRTPSEAGSVLAPGNEGNKVGIKRHTYFRKGVGNFLHMIRWS